jgi:hypothetical protein
LSSPAIGSNFEVVNQSWLFTFFTPGLSSVASFSYYFRGLM